MSKTTRQKKIFLTFDYEIFFGTSGTITPSLLAPTSRLLDVLREQGMKSTFFIDVLYYMRMAEDPLRSKPTGLIKEQLQRMVSEGHRIELHLHPHWLDARYNDGIWEFPSYRYFRLQALPEKRITELFVTGAEILNGIGGEVEKEYAVQAYRAGGWCIEPFDLLREGFQRSGIAIDSSVAPGMFGIGKGHEFDFRTVKPDGTFHRFKDVPSQSAPAGEFIEARISTYQKNLGIKMLSWHHNHFRPESKAFGDGTTMYFQTHESRLSKFATTSSLVTLERLPASIVSDIVQRYPVDEVVVISHPKGLSEESFTALRRLAATVPSTFLTLTKQHIEPLLTPETP